MEEDARQIPLSKGLSAWVSECDYARVNRHKWHANRHRIDTNGIEQFYARGWVKFDGVNKHVLLHKFVLDHWGIEQIDHRDLDRLNCTRSNLRIVSQSSNIQNQIPRNPTGFKGVRWQGGKKWIATIGHLGKRIVLGTFSDPRDAALAYDLKALELFGPDASLNIDHCGTRNTIVCNNLQENS